MSKEIQKTKAYYEKNAMLWAENKTNSFLHEPEFTKLVALLPKKGSVIDVGCAAGVHVPLFLGIGRSLTYSGIDISKSFLKIAKRRYPQLSFSLGNIADRKTLPRKKFDGFMAMAILMHVPFKDWDTAFGNTEKLCKPGAYGFLNLPTFHPSGDGVSTDPRHFTILNKDEQKSYLKSRNWKIIKSGVRSGTVTKGEWRWYIVQLPG